jgi:hypothetical protein
MFLQSAGARSAPFTGGYFPFLPPLVKLSPVLPFCNQRPLDEAPTGATPLYPRTLGEAAVSATPLHPRPLDEAAVNTTPLHPRAQVLGR